MPLLAGSGSHSSSRTSTVAKSSQPHSDARNGRFNRSFRTFFFVSDLLLVFIADHRSAPCLGFMTANVSSEIQCSMRQASCSATADETPSATKNLVSTRWRSYTFAATVLPAFVKAMRWSLLVTSCFSTNLLTAFQTDTLETFMASARSTSRIALLRSLNRNIVSRYISVDSFFSMISPFSLPCHCVFFAFFLLRTRTTVTVIAAATTRTQATSMTAYPHIGMTNATPGIQTMNVPVLSESNFTYRP